MKVQRDLFNWNITRALDWLFEVQDEDNFGWSWIRDISPNSQNTAEVVNVCSQLSDYLDSNQKALVSEAVENWLLEPSINGAIVIDYVWIMYSLIHFSEKYDDFAPSFAIEKVYLAAKECADLIIGLQNEDGGWGDNYGEPSTSTRTALVVYCLKSYTMRLGSTSAYDNAIQKGASLLISTQNNDGGWGNQPVQQVIKEFKGTKHVFSAKTISEQYLSQAVSTGYALMALGHISPHQYYDNIQRGVTYLRSIQNSDGSYDIFYEIGIRKDVIFTFRHLGTVWALNGLLRNTEISFSDDCISKAIYYLIQLQDDATGGWKCSPESDVYTWSTANALSILAKVLYICDNAFSLDLRNYVDDVLKSSIYKYAPESAAADKNTPASKPEVSLRKGKNRIVFLNLIIKILVLLTVLFISPASAFIVELLILVDIITLFIKGGFIE
ncbi:prenyltransferase/squalene oxidase repeat-containing protein [Mediterraneibacter glycyrrhizinilyticus]|uniref:prenyltransferase/squalene oxidase repeat-containing protein n=1 Tax=Mediterraneibacter glycyrrhizinilyticus TaxID=342942 RepID=UPI0025A4A502|nr:prenyltransferase/squalene oxidase repeat-containing protein [Mediterraneibacter glycyrrhizinilyticus]MDM8123989.1 prenyltransferase/squalene oxidase repeat-containing protein [Mediterraneibacter glycyrrhizinilyticus]